jgi:hypothetical protein
VAFLEKWRATNLRGGRCYIVFKRWDKLDEGDDPTAMVFFAVSDALSGLFTLANFDEKGP